MKIYSDYIPKYSKKDTLRYISKFKDEIIDALKYHYNLIEINQPVVCKTNEIFSTSRKIAFDNNFDEQIYEVPSFVNFSLINALNTVEAMPGSGVYCYANIIHRDIENTPSQANAENLLLFHVREYIANINFENMEGLTKYIVDALNSLPIRQEVGLKLPSAIKFTSIDKLCKTFPTIKKDKLIEQACLRHKLIFVEQTSGNNKHNLNVIENKLGVYGDIVGTLYVYNSISNTALKLLTMYSVPNKEQLIDQINRKELNVSSLQPLIDKAPNINNQIGFEFHISNYLVYALSKYSINEVVSCPCTIEMSEKLKKDIIL